MEARIVIENINRLPEHLLMEVNDFVGYLMEMNRIPKEKVTLKFGSLKGKIHMSENFDDPPEDFKDYM